ncbi:MAG: sodium ion-translocating decarboxylase subunit beta, partial [Bacteroidales bacterium]
MKRAITIFGILAVLSLVSWIIPGRQSTNVLEAAAVETVAAQEEPAQQLQQADEEELTFIQSARHGIKRFFSFSGFANATPQHLVMILVGLIFIYLAIKYEYEPLLLIPIGAGILLGNIPFLLNAGMGIGVYEQGSVLNILYFGVRYGIYPPLIFLGLGAMTDFSYLISNPKLLLLGAAAQVGIFITLISALAFGFTPPEAAAIGIIGGADGPTAIFTSSKLANGIREWNGITTANLIGPIAIAAYSYMA